MTESDVIFVAGAREYCGADVLLAAEFRGDLAPLRDAVRAGLACARYAGEEGFEVPGQELQAAADALRYDLDLETAEATEAWLARHQVTMDDLSEFLERRALLARFAGRRQELLDLHPPHPDEVGATLPIEALFGGERARLALELARRVAVRAAVRSGEPGPADAACERERAAFLARRGLADPATREAWQQESGVEPATFDDLLDLEGRFVAWRRERLTPDRLERERRAHRAELIRIETESATFPAAAIAREAVLCIRSDGDSMADVARRARTAVVSARGFLDEHPPALRTALLSARPGEVVGPVEEGADVYRVLRVTAKAEPVPSDPELTARLERFVLEPVLAQVVDAQVRWREPARGQ